VVKTELSILEILADSIDFESNMIIHGLEFRYVVCVPLIIRGREREKERAQSEYVKVPGIMHYYIRI
jgi:hypothetical protein